MNRLKMRLDKIAAETFVHKFTNPVIVDFWQDLNCIASLNLKEVPEYEKTISTELDKLMNSFGEKGFTKNIDFVDSIFTTIENYEAITTIKSDKELSSDELSRIESFLKNEFMIGWGEDFRQRKLDTFEIQDENGETISGDITARFWD